MAYGTITFAPFGSLNQSGVRLRMEGQNLIYRFKQQDGPKNASASGDQAREWGAGAFIGYEYVAEKFDMAGFVGVNYQRAILPKWVPDNSDSRTGIELSTEIDYHPIEPLSFCLNGSYSTASNFFWVQARPGLAALANVFVGPEFAYQSSKFIRQWRVGTHLGPIELGALAVTVAGGFSRDRAVRSGAYGAIETSFRF